MSDRLLLGLSAKELDDMENSIDMDKMRAFDKHNEDVKIMELTKTGLELYIKRFGKESNIYEKCKNLIVELNNNIEHTEKYKDLL